MSAPTQAVRPIGARAQARTAPVGLARHAMFFRMLMRAALVRRGRALTALFAVVVAAGVSTAMLNLYIDVQSKLQKEFRSYGANVVIVANEGHTLSSAGLAQIEQSLSGRGLAVPFAYAVAKTSDGSPVVVAGADFDRVRRLNSWWSVTAWPSAPNTALVGKRAAATLSPDGKPFQLTFEGRTLTIAPAGTLQTGASEDSRVYLSMADFAAWTGVQPSSIEIAAAGSSEEIAATVQQLSGQVSDAEVKPVRQIVEAEARVLGKTRMSLGAACAVIIFTAALCVLATLTAWVLEQRRNFAIMKALGASERLVNGFFAAEAGALGASGAVIGFLIGIGVAAWIGRVNFHAAVVPRFGVFPIVFAGSIFIALLSALVPISLLRRVQPATILRGE
jgi:putative ABC transport system permease protein